jgi:hypothetical protein
MGHRIILYLALWGRHNLRKIGPILIFIVYLAAMRSVPIGSIRYWLPIKPFLIIFASVALRHILRSACTFPPAFAAKQPSGGRI